MPAPSAFVYSTIAPRSYEITADTGAVRDPENLFVMRSRQICFRGSESDLVAAFRMGSKNAPSGGDGMICAGVMNAELVPGTAGDPHWDAEVKWMGLHTAHKNQNIAGLAADDFQYRIITNWDRTETTFPITAQDAAGNPYTIYIGTPFVSSPTHTVGAATVATRARLINFVPMLQIVGVMRDAGVQMISPASPKIKALISLLNANFKPPQELLQDWTQLPDPLLTYAKGFLGTGQQNGVLGAYVPAGMQSHRQVSVGEVHAFTLDLIWEQGKVPG